MTDITNIEPGDESIYKESENITEENLAPEPLSSQEEPDNPCSDDDHKTIREETQINTSEARDYEQGARGNEYDLTPPPKGLKKTNKGSLGDKITLKRFIYSLVIVILIITLIVKGPDLITNYSINQMGDHNVPAQKK